MSQVDHISNRPPEGSIPLRSTHLPYFHMIVGGLAGVASCFALGKWRHLNLKYMTFAGAGLGAFIGWKWGGQSPSIPQCQGPVARTYPTYNLPKNRTKNGTLKPDIIRKIADFGTDTIVLEQVMRRVCKHWHNALSNHDWWERCLARDFPGMKCPEGVHPRDFYRWPWKWPENEQAATERRCEIKVCYGNIYVRPKEKDAEKYRRPKGLDPEKCEAWLLLGNPKVCLWYSKIRIGQKNWRLTRKDDLFVQFSFVENRYYWTLEQKINGCMQKVPIDNLPETLRWEINGRYFGSITAVSSGGKKFFAMGGFPSPWLKSAMSNIIMQEEGNPNSRVKLKGHAHCFARFGGQWQLLRAYWPIDLRKSPRTIYRLPLGGGNETATQIDSSVSSLDALTEEGDQDSLLVALTEKGLWLNRGELTRTYAVGKGRFQNTGDSRGQVRVVSVMDKPFVIANWITDHDAVYRNLPKNTISNLVVYKVGKKLQLTECCRVKLGYYARHIYLVTHPRSGYPAIILEYGFNKGMTSEMFDFSPARD